MLGPLLFTAYVSAFGRLIESYGVLYHQFADNTQLLVSMDSTNATPAIDRLACSIVASRLDYCNALLSRAPAATFNTLQRTQNLARVVCQSRGRTDARPLLHSLHCVEFYLYPTVGTVLIHSIKPELTE